MGERQHKAGKGREGRFLVTPAAAAAACPTPFIRLSIYIYIYIHTSIHLSICPLILLSVHLSIYPCIHLSIYHLSIIWMSPLAPAWRPRLGTRQPLLRPSAPSDDDNTANDTVMHCLYDSSYAPYSMHYVGDTHNLQCISGKAEPLSWGSQENNFPGEQNQSQRRQPHESKETRYC
jgi:hypothetical protein